MTEYCWRAWAPECEIPILILFMQNVSSYHAEEIIATNASQNENSSTDSHDKWIDFWVNKIPSTEDWQIYPNVNTTVFIFPSCKTIVISVIIVLFYKDIIIHQLMNHVKLNIEVTFLSCSVCGVLESNLI